MKAYCVIIVGQEINGNNVVVKLEKCSTDKNKIDQFLIHNKPTWIEKHQVPEGSVDMFFQRNAQEFEVEDV